MLSVGEDVEGDALFKRGWTISAIARHLDRDQQRRVATFYLSGERTPVSADRPPGCARGLPRTDIAALFLGGRRPSVGDGSL